LRQDWRALEAQSPQQISLVTLGDCAIRVNGQDLKLEGGTSKAVEFLAFLLEEGESRIETIIAALFFNGTHETARNRIHKMRESIAQQIPGLTIPYCKARNTYQLEPASVRLQWDVRGLRQALNQGGVAGMQRALALYPGSFLPRSDADWAEDKRFKLEFDLVRVGIEALTELFTLERYDECLRLAERLSDIATLNLGVQLMVLKATSRVHGKVAAQARLQRVDPLIQEDLRALPEVQLELRGQEQDYLN
jgi:DNA-binding SARP family transcriptional activator